MGQLDEADEKGNVPTEGTPREKENILRHSNERGQ